MCICLDSSKDWEGSQDVAYQVKVLAAQQAATLSSFSGTRMMGEENQVLTQYSQHKWTVAHEHSWDTKQTFKNQQTGQKQQNSSGCHGGWQSANVMKGQMLS